MSRHAMVEIVGPALLTRGAALGRAESRDVARELAASGLRLPDLRPVLERALGTCERTAAPPVAREPRGHQMEMS